MSRAVAARRPVSVRRQRVPRLGPGAAPFVVVTGLSGAGKSHALRALEDLGYFCVDNLPMALIPAFAELVLREQLDPNSGTTARSTNGIWNLALSPAYTKSQCVSMVVPPPMAAPCTAATSGLSKSTRAFISRSCGDP